MGKLLRIIAWLAGLLVAVVIVASIILPMIIDPNDHKDDIAALVKEKTGRTLTVNGDIGLSVFPWLAFEIGAVSLSNAAGFSNQPFASVSDVQIRIKLLPLLSKQIEMNTIVLDGLSLSLETLADGRNNWADLSTSADDTVTAEENSPEDKVASGGGMALAGLALGGVAITDATLVWDDKSSGARYSIEGLGLRAGAVKLGATVPVELSLQLASAEPAINGPVNFEGQVTLSEDGRIVQLQQAELTADLQGDGLPGGWLKSSLLFESVLNLDDGQLDINGLVASLLGLTIRVDVKGMQLFDKPVFTGVIQLGEFIPRELLKAMGQPLPEVSDPTVLGKANASLKFAATTDSVKLSSVLISLDDSMLDGNLSVSDFAKPAVRFELQLDRIDVDRYLPPGTGAAPVPVTPTTAVAASTQMIPMETLRQLDVDGRLKIGQLKAYQLRSTDIEMKLVANTGVVRVYPARAKMYQGSYAGDIKLDVRGKQPKISLNEKLQAVQVGPLLKDLIGEDTLSGTANGTAILVTTGQSPEQMKKTLNGKLGFSFANGAVKGFNLAAMLRKAQAQITGKPVPKETEANQTDFSELSGTASITNGVIRNRDLLAKTPLLRVQGKGDIDLPKEALDYLVTAKVVSSLEGQGGRKLTDLKGVSVPVQLSGTFENPKYKIRLDKAMQKSVEKKVKKKLEEKFGNQLKGLFNQN